MAITLPRPGLIVKILALYQEKGLEFRRRWRLLFTDKRKKDGYLIGLPSGDHPARIWAQDITAVWPQNESPVPAYVRQSFRREPFVEPGRRTVLISHRDCLTTMR